MVIFTTTIDNETTNVDVCTFMLENICGSRARAKLIGWLYSHADDSYFVRELSSILNEDPSNLSREMSRLESAGILVSSKRGNLKLVQADKKCPVYNELKLLAIKDLQLQPIDID